MSTLPPPAVKVFPESSLEKQCYNLAESFKQFLPVMNDRNRLGFNLYRLVTGEGDTAEVIIRTNKFTLEGITGAEFAKKIEEGVASIKK